MDLSLLSNQYFEVISKIRQKLLEKGANTIATLPRYFKSMPTFDGQNKVNASDFFNCLSSCGLNLIKEEAVLICKFIDKDSSGLLNFEDFNYALRGKPNEDRQEAIDLVFNIFDKAQTGTADAKEMRKVFNCAKHQKFQMGKLSEDQIFYLYLKNFNNQVKETVTKKEWDDYYAGISVAIDDDYHFVRLIKNQFKVE